MSALTYVEAMRLKHAMNIGWQELAVIGALIEHRVISRACAAEAIELASPTQRAPGTRHVCVVVCRLREAMPAGHRIATNRDKFGPGAFAESFEISDTTRNHLRALAQAAPKQARAA